jgi:hypothetical protein
MFGVRKRKVAKVFYEIPAKCNVDAFVVREIEPGIYWTRVHTGILASRSSRIWVEYASGIIEEKHPSKRHIDPTMKTWLHLQATHLNWYETGSRTASTGAR